MLQHHIRQGLNTLGSDFTLFVVDLLGLLVAEQEYDCAEQEDGGAPAHAVRPPKLPHLPVACNMNTRSTTLKQTLGLLEFYTSMVWDEKPVFHSVWPKLITSTLALETELGKCKKLNNHVKLRSPGIIKAHDTLRHYCSVRILQVCISGYIIQREELRQQG